MVAGRPFVVCCNDFFELVDGNTIVHVHADVELVGEAAGSKLGGTVELEVHELAVECKADDIPDKIQVNIEGLGLGQVIHISDLTAIPGIKFSQSAKTPVVVCHKAKSEEEPAPAEEE